MIIYDLICDTNHRFEGWFKSANDFVRQLEQGLLTCPMCDSANIRKLPSASHIATTPSKADAKPESALMPVQADEARARAAFAVLQEYAMKNSIDVGARFVEEAKKMHYGETEEKNIRGHATFKDIVELHEEGIRVLPLPGVPEKQKLN